MFQKNEITKTVLEIIKPEASPKDFQQAKDLWWFSKRSKNKGGLRLTSDGFDAFLQAEIKSYKVAFDKPFQTTNQLLIYMDNMIDCPFFITKKDIHLFGEKAAVQLVLFSGNLPKFVYAKAGKVKST